MVQPNELNILNKADRWWVDEIYNYTLLALNDEIMQIKTNRANQKTLSEESYDFVVHIAQVA